MRRRGWASAAAVPIVAAMRSARFPPAPAPAALTPGARAYLRKLQARIGFVPHLQALLAESEVALRAYGELAALYGAATLTPTERQVVMLTVTRRNGAPYCLAGHSAVAEATGVAVAVILALREGQPLPDPRLQALRAFTDAAHGGCGVVDDTTWAAFDAAGYSRQQALEVLVGITLKTFSNLASRMTGVALDEGFRTWAWTADHGHTPAAQAASP
jgi:AhpD family alkylhydroperoxidase